MLSEYRIRAIFSRESRHERSAPHIGRVELATVYRDDLSRPLPSVLDGESFLGSLRICEQTGYCQENTRRRNVRMSPEA